MDQASKRSARSPKYGVSKRDPIFAQKSLDLPCSLKENGHLIKGLCISHNRSPVNTVDESLMNSTREDTAEKNGLMLNGEGGIFSPRI